ncbi:hypothetical protein PsorP6_010204 [Peronosclerospora sorghi]|uniref:Uncharacterized protein n=1 Tax=Peronosclerospora sorghi TaxID=230839 RepID=A0ACC0VW73_9STRA|nr:hypothetical protein PsorP6_010204 [Peronosclerospora sorghi]
MDEINDGRICTETDEDVVATDEDAYVRHVTLVLSTILNERPEFRDLFSADELRLASRFLTELQPFEQHVYARLLQRHGPWYKTTSLFRYFIQERTRTTHPSEQPVPSTHLPGNEKVQKVVTDMITAGFLTSFPATSAAASSSHVATVFSREQQELHQLETALDAIAQCASASELTRLYQKLTGRKRNGTKLVLMEAIKKVAKSQPRIDGSRLPVAPFMQQIWVEGYPLTRKQKTDVMVFQMTPVTRDVIVRMHRLFYFMSTLPFHATSLQSIQSDNVGQLLASAMHKVRYEPTQWPGLMAFFNKVTYPEYTLRTSATDGTNSTQLITATHRVFPSSEAYVAYEVAYQLHQLMNHVDRCLEIQVPDGYQEADLECKWLVVDEPPVFHAFQRLLRILDEEDEATKSIDDCGIVMLDSTQGEEKRNQVAQNWQLRSWEHFHDEMKKIQTLDEFVFIARNSLQAYLKWMKTGAYGTSHVPIYFSKCNAGYHLVRVLHTAVGLYEKMRKYQIAILVLNDLLAAPFLERKRGYWWDRLALNLEHLHCRDQAKDTCANALNDPHVLAADQMSLRRRLHRLQHQKPDCKEKNQVKVMASGDQVPQTVETSGIATSQKDGDGLMQGKDTMKQLKGRDATDTYRLNRIVGRPLNRQMGQKSRFVGYDDEPCTVEQLVLQYYREHDIPQDSEKTGGWYGVHSEGMVLVNLFGILMWDVLYAALPDVFQTPFQAAPLDFGYADVFYQARSELIESRLRQVQSEWTIEELLRVFVTRWNAELNKVTRFVHWPTDDATVSLAFHLLTIVAIGRKELTKLLHYMATSREFHQAQNGLPDLLLLRMERSCPDMSLSVDWPLDSHDCLNMYAFCGMNKHLNLNEKPLLDTERMVVDDAPEKRNVRTLEKVLELIQESNWAARLKVVEVKGPRDRLSDKQRLWLEVLNEQVGLDASVMQVEEPEQRAKRKEKQVAKRLTQSTGNKRKKKRKGAIGG